MVSFDTAIATVCISIRLSIYLGKLTYTIPEPH